jgi:hypothetical protein
MAMIGRTVLARLTLLLLVAAAMATAVVTLRPREPALPASDAAAVAAGWVGAGTPQPPRRDDNEWEVDIARPNGSLVEVTVGKSRELVAFDEERGRGGGPAPDELRGPTRARAVHAARAAVGPGRVVSAERESGGGIEVGSRWASTVRCGSSRSSARIQRTSELCSDDQPMSRRRQQRKSARMACRQATAGGSIAHRHSADLRAAGWRVRCACPCARPLDRGRFAGGL